MRLKIERDATLVLYIIASQTTIELLGRADLVPALLMEKLPQVVQAAGYGALVGVRVLQVLIRDVGTGQEGVLGFVQASLVHQDDSRVQVGGYRYRQSERSWINLEPTVSIRKRGRRSLHASVGRLPMAIL